MKPPEEVKRELVRQWLDKAEGDYRLVRHLASDQTEFFGAIGFHSQQVNGRSGRGAGWRTGSGACRSGASRC